MKYLTHSLLFVLIYCSSSIATLAFDVEKQGRIAEQTLETLFVGEPLWLRVKHLSSDTVSETKFLSLLTESEDPKGTIILVHGTGLGPDTPFVIGPLRELLADSGYTTLAIQMPVLSDGAEILDYQAEFPEARKRLSAAVNYLKNRGSEKIIVVAHSLGSSMMMDWIDHSNVNNLSALVSLGLGSSNNNGKLAKGGLNIPFLDVVGENDYTDVLKESRLRKKIITATNIESKQITLKGLNHFYTDNEEVVSNQIIDWLESL